MPPLDFKSSGRSRRGISGGFDSLPLPPDLNMKRIYLDNAATTPLLPEVKKFLCESLDTFGNPSSPHAVGKEVKGLIEDVRGKIAKTLKVSSDELVFTSCATEGNNTVLASVLKGKRGNVVLSAIEHKSVSEAVKLWGGRDVEMREVPVNKEGVIDLEELEKLVDKDTLLVCVMYVSNEFGTVQPVEEIAKICTSKGVPFLSDAVQAIGKVPVDLRNVSYATFSGHKLHAPKGVGFTFVSEGSLYEPLLVGGGQERGKRSGTENLTGILAMGKALEVVYSKFEENVKSLKKLRDLFEELLLEELPDAKIVGKEAERNPSISAVIMPKLSGWEIVQRLSEVGVMCSSGSACTSGEVLPNQHLLKMGFTAEESIRMVRFSFGLLNNEEEVREAVRRIKGLYN